ncbi:MAG: Lrp/AsnC family transcriptional regulator [Proteobacteria bacterium]|nr:Lrp/AsnC family transcriptional regulator [Pseudomonadota bacterium]
MVTSIILLNVKRHKINDVANLLTDRSEVSEVYSVSGKYDLIAIVRVAENDELSEFVTNHLSKIKGIKKTDTMLAFKAYSKHDLEVMFSI